MASSVQTIKDVAKLQAHYESIHTVLEKQNTILDDQSKVLQKVLEQTLKTNGRVSALEDWKQTVKDSSRELVIYRRWIIGVILGIIPLVGGVSLTITKFIINEHISKKVTEEVQVAMANVLDGYKVEIE